MMRTLRFAYRDVGKEREQDAEALRILRADSFGVNRVVVGCAKERSDVRNRVIIHRH
jgi:hypothetical protein